MLAVEQLGISCWGLSFIAHSYSVFYLNCIVKIRWLVNFAISFFLITNDPKIQWFKITTILLSYRVVGQESGQFFCSLSLLPGSLWISAGDWACPVGPRHMTDPLARAAGSLSSAEPSALSRSPGPRTRSLQQAQGSGEEAASLFGGQASKC